MALGRGTFSPKCPLSFLENCVPLLLRTTAVPTVWIAPWNLSAPAYRVHKHSLHASDHVFYPRVDGNYGMVRQSGGISTSVVVGGLPAGDRQQMETSLSQNLRNLLSPCEPIDETEH